MALPDFLLVGAPKAGTTALHVALAGHPQLAMSSIKEPKFFLTDGPPPTGGGPGDAKTYAEYIWRQEDYEALWSDAEPDQLLGESTTLYLQDPEAHRRIAKTVPEAKLIAVLRDPVDRAHSNWAHLRSHGLEPVADFPRACMLGERRAEQGWGPFWRYLEIGRYGAQLEHLYSLFDREQVLVLLYRELREEPVTTLDRVCDFLGVQTGLLDRVPAENVTAHVDEGLVNAALHRALQGIDSMSGFAPAPVQRAASSLGVKLLQREQRTRPALTTEERSLLLPHYYEDLVILEKQTGRSFAHWRDPENSRTRRALDIDGRFGTGFTSIDRPGQR
jgi:sulfotransferase family protein